MLSKHDLQNIQTIISNEIQPLRKEIQEIKIDIMLLRQEMDERFTQVYKDMSQLREEMYAIKAELKEDILLFKDDICKLILDLQTDVTVVTEYKDVIEDHEIRIVDLEKYSRPN